MKTTVLSKQGISDHKYTPRVQNMVTVPNPPRRLATTATRSSVVGTVCFGSLWSSYVSVTAGDVKGEKGHTW